MDGTLTTLIRVATGEFGQMLYRIMLAGAAGLLSSGAVLAQNTATNVDDCLKQTFELAQSAEEKNLPDAKLDKLETLLTRMEANCDANKFAEASADAAEIRQVIEAE